MNRSYKLVWNAVQQAWVVASELGKSHKKSKAARLVLAVAALSVGQLAMAAPATRAIPVLDNIASGTASVTSGLNPDTNRTNLTVSQTSGKLIANWTSFDVGQFSEVIFKQNSASNITLNRINSGSPSQIFGQVKSQIDTPTGPISAGQLIIVNPAGIVFGSSARVNAGSVIASTLDITDANFNAGVLQFDRGSSTGAIDIQKQGDNQGIIMAENGNTFVFAPTVTNSGTVRAQAGNVTIANGNRLTVDATAGTATLNQVSGIAGLIQSTGVIRGDRLTTTDKGKVFIVGDRARTGSVVNLAGEITSTGNDVKAKTLNITADLSVNSNTNINAINSINVNNALNVIGNNRLISIDYDNDAAGDDYLYFDENGKISMPGNTITYREQGVTYNIIRTLAELQAIGTNSTTLADKYVLGAGIDASITATTAFTPIGSTSSTPFTGFISGLGNTVSNLTINLPSTSGVGLFGYAQNSTIKSLKLSNVNITGNQYVGGLIGQSGTYNEISKITGNGSVVFNNYISGSVNGANNIGGLIGANYDTLASHNKSSAAVLASSNNAGGLIGLSIDSTISSSSSSGDVSGKYYVGGLIGSNSNGVIGNNYALGNVSGKNSVGGLIGINKNSPINMSYAKGSITALVKENFNFGGLVGDNSGDSSDVVSNSYATGSVNGILANGMVSNVGGLIGNNTGVPIENSYSTGWVSGKFSLGGLIGYNSYAAVNNSYASGNLTGYDVTGGLIGTNGNSTVSNSHAIGVVNGNLGKSGGLIGAISYSEVNDSYATGGVDGGQGTGGLVGYSINSSISGSYATGSVVALNHAGGLIGEYELNNSYNNYYNGVVKVDKNYALGSVIGGGKLGGLIGYVNIVNYTTPGYEMKTEWSIINNYAQGNIDTPYGSNNAGGLIGEILNQAAIFKIENNYSTGQVSNNFSSNRGGVVGFLSGIYSSGNIESNYWDKTLNNLSLTTINNLPNDFNSNSGLDATQSKQLSSYSGWDISNQLTGSSSIWYINDGVSTPVLRALMTP